MKIYQNVLNSFSSFPRVFHSSKNLLKVRIPTPFKHKKSKQNPKGERWLKNESLYMFECVVKTLIRKGLCRTNKNKTLIPIRKTSWLNLNLRELLKRYNLAWEIIVDFKCFSKQQLKFLRYILQHSAACSFMSKLKLRSRRQVFLRYGAKLTIREEGKTYSLNF